MKRLERLQGELLEAEAVQLARDAWFIIIIIIMIISIIIIVSIVIVIIIMIYWVPWVARETET